MSQYTNPNEIMVHKLLSLKVNIKLEMHVAIFFNSHLRKRQILHFIIKSEISVYIMSKNKIRIKIYTKDSH